MRAAVLLIISSTFVGLLEAQYANVGCTRQVTLPSATYTVPTYQPQCQYQCPYYQPPPQRVNVVPFNPYCPSYVQQNIVPPPPPTVYQSQPIIVPIPPPPKDCTSAHTTVTAPTLNGTQQNPAHHPPICVQTVYVARDDEDKKEEKKKCECKKRKKEPDSEPDHDEEEDRIFETRRRAAFYRLQQMKKRQILRNLSRVLDSQINPRMLNNFDLSSSGFDSSLGGYLNTPVGGSLEGGGGGGSCLSGLFCNMCPEPRTTRSNPDIVFIDGQRQ